MGGGDRSVWQEIGWYGYAKRLVKEIESSRATIIID